MGNVAQGNTESMLMSMPSAEWMALFEQAGNRSAIVYLALARAYHDMLQSLRRRFEATLLISFSSSRARPICAESQPFWNGTAGVA